VNGRCGLLPDRALCACGPGVRWGAVRWLSAGCGFMMPGTRRGHLLLAQGVDQRVVMEILGHSQISMTSRYAHALPQVMTDAAERIGQALLGEK